MTALIFALAVAAIGDKGVDLLPSHNHEKVYIWIKNHSPSEVRSLTVRLTSVDYKGEHVIWGKDNPPIPAGNLKRVTLTIPEFEGAKRKDIKATIISLNGVKIATPEPAPAKPKELRLSFYVDRVLDGDTLKVQDENGEEYAIRLNAIDAPESSQRFGLDARNELSRYTIGKTLVGVVTGQDRYGRRLVRLYDQMGNDINLLMIQKGMAWHYKKYSDSKELERAEAIARTARVGVWSVEKRIAPWDYRNGVRNESVKPQNAASIRTTDRTVYITETGSKYHSGGCRYLSKSKIPIPLSRAKSAYTPCSRCNP